MGSDITKPIKKVTKKIDPIDIVFPGISPSVKAATEGFEEAVKGLTPEQARSDPRVLKLLNEQKRDELNRKKLLQQQQQSSLNARRGGALGTRSLLSGLEIGVGNDGLRSQLG